MGGEKRTSIVECADRRTRTRFGSIGSDFSLRKRKERSDQGTEGMKGYRREEDFARVICIASRSTTRPSTQRRDRTAKRSRRRGRVIVAVNAPSSVSLRFEKDASNDQGNSHE